MSPSTLETLRPGLDEGRDEERCVLQHQLPRLQVPRGDYAFTTVPRRYHGVGETRHTRPEVHNEPQQSEHLSVCSLFLNAPNLSTCL